VKFADGDGHEHSFPGNPKERKEIRNSSRIIETMPDRNMNVGEIKVEMWPD
jgi:hypothetical protein